MPENSIRAKILETISYVSPYFYKRIVFKKYRKANFENLELLKLKAEAFLLKYLMKPDQKLLDVGAHIGEFIYMSKGVVDKKNVLAFEPNPESFKRLRRIYRHYHVYNIALSNQNGTAQFKIPSILGKSIPTRGTLKTSFVEIDESGQQLINVKTQTIDSFVREHRLTNIGLIKIDVEGFEENVIIGAKETIKKQHPVLIAELEQRHMDEPLDNVIERIKNLGYRCFYYDSDCKCLVELTQATREVQLAKFHKVNPVKYVNNFIFIPENSRLLVEMQLIK